MLLIRSEEYDGIFYALGLVCILIISRDNLSKAQIRGEFFHNVSAKRKYFLNLQIVISRINEKAVRHDCETMISVLFSRARKNA